VDWKLRLNQEPEDMAAGADAMDAINPLYIPRNHRVEHALSAAVDEADMAPFERLLQVLKHPFEWRDGLEEFERPNPDADTAYKTFCGT